MVVDKKEIELLKKSIEQHIAEMEASPSKNSAELFDLHMLDSNISLFLLNAEFHDGPLELGSHDKQIKEALKNFRSGKVKNDDPAVLIEETAVHAREIVDLLRQAEEKLKLIPDKMLSENLKLRLDVADTVLMQIILLKDAPKSEKKKWLSERIPLPPSTAGRTLGSMTSDKKAAASRANGKKGGRPRKNPAVAPVSKASQKSKKSSLSRRSV